MPTNQRLALLFNNAIGPEQEPMRAQPTLLKSELNLIRRSPATAGATPSLQLGIAHCNSLESQVEKDLSLEKAFFRVEKSHFPHGKRVFTAKVFFPLDFQMNCNEIKYPSCK